MLVRLGGFPDASRTDAEASQCSNGPLTSFLYGQSDIAVMTEHLLPLLKTRLFIRITSLEVHEFLASPEAHATVPLPGNIRVTAVISEAPHRMYRTDLGPTVETLLGRCRTYITLMHATCNGGKDTDPGILHTAC